MKIVIRVIIIVLFTTLSQVINAQSFGIKAGYNSSNMLIKETEIFVPYNTYDESYRMNHGFHVGIVTDLPLFKMFSVETGLFYSVKGTKGVIEIPFESSMLITHEKYNLSFLEIPLSVKVPFSLGNFEIYGSAGPYVGLGLTGKINKSYSYNDLVENEGERINWGSSPGVSHFKRFDYGLTFGTGVNIKSFLLGVSYNLGLANLSPESTGGSVRSNRILGVSVGYMFGGSHKDPEKKSKSVAERPEKIQVQAEKSGKNKTSKDASKIEAEKLWREKVRADSIAAIKAEQHRLNQEKIRADSIENARVIAARIESEKVRLEKLRSDSIAAAQKKSITTKDIIVYKVQFASNTVKKGNYSFSINGRNFNTWEYFYSGAYRSTVGEFSKLSDAMAFQKVVRQSGYPQAFVVAFKNNIRSTDPALFR